MPEIVSAPRSYGEAKTIALGVLQTVLCR